MPESMILERLRRIECKLDSILSNMDNTTINPLLNDVKEIKVHHTCTIHVSELQYAKYLKSFDEPLRDNTIEKYWQMAKNYMQRHDTITEDHVRTYLSQFTNTSTYNNHLKALKHLARMNSSDINIKLKRTHNERLIIAPNYDTVRCLLENIQDTTVKAYLSLCATTGIRVERLLNLTWNDIDFNDGLVLKRIEHLRTKHYRPNPLHNDVSSLIDGLPKDKERVFPMESKRVRRAIRKTGVRITPTQLRDFFYNQALNCGMNPVIVEWLMGHDIGIAKHYLADNIKQEYSKFERAVTFS